MCLASLQALSQDHIDRIRLLLITGALKYCEGTSNIDVTSNITDISGNKLIIKTKNFNTITLVKTIMDQNDTYKAFDDADVPGLRVKILLPAWFQPLLDANQFIKVITLHNPTLSSENFSQYQPTKKLQSGSILYYTSLDYTAQSYFVKLNWKLALLGTTLSFCDADAGGKTAPGIQEDSSPTTSLEGLNLQSDSPPATTL